MGGGAEQECPGQQAGPGLGLGMETLLREREEWNLCLQSPGPAQDSHEERDHGQQVQI